ncbi:MAG TPA: CDP-diacylglycerol--serine O-phosphatidyltransferase [Bacteroidota bacterium]|nr:CDP-diacylglycerol--serine O-phosphatidyltransferase [Bacteroidota bacterium]
MKKIKINRSSAPNFFTAMNMVFGFLCIIFASKGEFYIAAFFIVFAALCDSLDGIVARLTKSSSKFGVELDSLADVISFGVAPSTLVYFLYFHTFDTWGIILSTLPMIFAAMRLARFNVQLVGFDKEFFYGMPAPSAAITLSSFVIFFYDESGLTSFQKDPLIPLTICLSLLMISTFKYDTFPKFSKKGIKRNPIKFTIFVVGFILIIITKGKAILPLFIIYIFSGIFRTIIKISKQLLRHKRNEENKVKLID